MAKSGWFDATAFYQALDGVRLARRRNWKQVAGESGVSASTLTRMAQGRRPDVDGLAALTSWSGLRTEDFVRAEGDVPKPEPLAMISTYLRSDKNLSPEAAAAIDELVKATYQRLRSDGGEAMTLRWGFKTEAKDLAEDIRAELGIGPLTPLRPMNLADRLGIPVLIVSEMAGASPLILPLLGAQKAQFSAATVFRGPIRVIVHNDAHAPARQNSNLAHELAHSLLQHPATPPLNEHGCREWDDTIEEEAEWLAGILLVTETAALEIARGRWTKEEAALHFEVSQAMIQRRVNATGAVRRVQRTRALGAR